MAESLDRGRCFGQYFWTRRTERSRSISEDQTPPDLTRLLEASTADEPGARDKLFSQVYDDLRRVAQRRLGVGRPGDTLQATALVHETIIELVRRLEQGGPLRFASRQEFYTTAALAMRSILRDHHRARSAAKRGGGQRPSSLELDPPAPLDDRVFATVDYLSLDASLDALERHDRRWYQVIMLRFYAGRSIDETAELLGLGVTAVKTDWKYARAWLLRDIRGGTS